GPDGLINIPSPGVPPKLNSRHKAFLARIVEEGPIPAIHGVVRWRAGDLITRLYEEVGLSVSDDTSGRGVRRSALRQRGGRALGCSGRASFHPLCPPGALPPGH